MGVGVVFSVLLDGACGADSFCCLFFGGCAGEEQVWFCGFAGGVWQPVGLAHHWNTQMPSLMMSRTTAAAHPVTVTMLAMLTRMSVIRFGLLLIVVLFDGVFAWVFVSLVLSFDAADESLGRTVGSVTG